VETPSSYPCSKNLPRTWSWFAAGRPACPMTYGRGSVHENWQARLLGGCLDARCGWTNTDVPRNDRRVRIGARAGRAVAASRRTIEPAAVERLNATSERLAGAKSLSFTTVTTYESPARNGQPLYNTTLSAVELQRPDRLRVITPGDGPPSDFYYDGKTMTAYTPGADLAAVADAPPTIDEALKVAYDKAPIYFPFAEVIVADPAKNLGNGLTSAFYVGQSHVVGDTVTDIIAIANDHVQAEIWIGVDDGLPRMMRAIYPTDPAKSRNEIVFSHWRLNEPTKDSDFTSTQEKKGTSNTIRAARCAAAGKAVMQGDAS
jgi:hypothetical protein